MRNLTRWETMATCRDGDVNGHGLGGVVAGPGVSSARLLGAAVVQIGSQPDAVLAQLASSKKLRAVSFSSGGPTAEGYAVLESIPTIESLAFAFGGVDFAALSRLPQLRELSLSGLPRTAAADLLVKHVPNLEVLHLDAADDACMAVLAQCAHLREVCIAACRCSPAGLQHLGQLSKLTALSLGEVREEGAAWDFLERLTRLRAFTAPQANGAYVYGFDDAALQRLAKLPVELLQLDHVAVTDAGLPSLLQMQQLRWLELLDMPHISEAGAKQFNVKKLTATHVKIQADDRTVRARKGEVATCPPLETHQLFWWETGAPVRNTAPRSTASVVDLANLRGLVETHPAAAFVALSRALSSSSSSSSTLLPLATRVARHFEDRLTEAPRESLRDALGAFSTATGVEIVLDDDLDEGVSQATAALQEWVAGFRR